MSSKWWTAAEVDANFRANPFLERYSTLVKHAKISGADLIDFTNASCSRAF
jgi:hypothetical protein